MGAGLNGRRWFLAALGREGLPNGTKQTAESQTRLYHVGRHPYPAARGDLCHEVNHPFLDHRGLAVPDQFELGLVDIDADYRVAVAGKACQRNSAYVPQTEDADSHLVPRILPVTNKNTRSIAARNVLMSWAKEQVGRARQ